MNNHTKKENRPEPGKVYALTGTKEAKCIVNGNTWAESEVTLSRWEKTEKGRPVPQLKS